MSLILPGANLTPRMDAESLVRLGGDLSERLDSLQQEYGKLSRAAAVWWRWYHAVPRTETKDYPFKNASNVVVPLIGITCDALTSRSLSQLTAAAPNYWMGRTENEDRQRTVRDFTRYVNWQADGNDFSLKHVLAGGLPEMHVTGRTVLAACYRRDVRPMFFGRTGRDGRSALERAMVEFAKGPLVEHVPLEHIAWDRRHRIGDAPMVGRYHEWSWAELRAMAKLDPAWDAEAVQEVRAEPGPDEGVDNERIRREKDKLALRDSDDAMLDSEFHGVWELHVDWSMLGIRFEVPGDEKWEGTQVPLVIHLHRRTQRVLRITGSPYLLPYKPFVDLRWRHGNHGVAKALEQFQSMFTTMANQSFDARTRSNALWGKTTNPKLHRQPLDPGRLTLVDTMGELEPMRFEQPIQQDVALMQLLQVLTERWMGSSDPLLGRETRSGGHPAPATSTLALLVQTEIMSAGTDVMLQEELGRLGEMISILDQQFEDNERGKIQQVLGVRDAVSAGEYLFPDEPIPGNYWLDVVALSRSDNPDSRMRRALMVAQAYQNYAALSAQGMAVIESPQTGPRVKAVWTKILEGYGSLLERFLSASNIDDGEKYLVELEKLGINAQDAFRQFLGEAQRAAAGAAGGAGGPPGAGAAGGPGAVSATGSLVGVGGGAAAGAGRQFAGLGIQ